MIVLTVVYYSELEMSSITVATIPSIIQRLDVKMRICKITENFNPTLSFSDSGLSIHVSRHYVELSAMLDNTKLLNDDIPKTFTSQEKINFENTAGYETTVVMNLAKVLSKISSDVVLESKYKKIMDTTNIVKVERLGMGSLNTWHGTPDIRVRGATGEVDVIG